MNQPLDLTPLSRAGPGISVLYVEDDELAAEIFAGRLRTVPSAAPRLTVARSLGEALALLASDRFDLVLADLNLPDSRGLDTLKALRRASDCLVVALSGDDDPALPEKAPDSGALYFLHKQNFDSQEFDRLVRLAALQRQANDALRASEARFRSLAGLSSDWYWEQDAELRFSWFSEEKERKSGSSRRLTLGLRRWEIPGVTPFSDSWDEHKATLEARKPYRDFEYRRIGEDGKLRYISVSGEPMFDEAGAFKGYRGIARDVTARKLAEKRLRDGEERFRAIYEQAAVGIAIRGLDGRWLRVNEKLCQILGYSREELLALTSVELTPLDERGTAVDLNVRMMRGEISTYSREKRYLRKDGSIVWVNLSVNVVKDSEGKPLHLISVIADITDRKNGEQALRRLGRMYAVLSATNEAILHAKTTDDLLRRTCEIAVDSGEFTLAMVRTVDPESGWTRVAALTGHDAAGFGIHPISVDPTHPEGQGLVGIAFRSGEPVIVRDFLSDPRSRAWHQRAQGAGIASVGVFPLWRDGRCVGVLILHGESKDAFDDEMQSLIERMAKNISFALDNLDRDAQRREAEARVRESETRFRSLTEMSSDFYWETDTEHRVTRRGAGEKSTPFLPIVTPIGKTRWEIPSFVPDQAGWEAHRAVLDAHEPFRDFEICRPAEDGGERWTLVSGDPIFDGDGRFLGYRGVGRDITEQRRAEKRQAAHARQQELVAEFGRYALGLHETQALFDDTVRTVSRGIEADAVAYYELLPGEDKVVLRAGGGGARGGAAIAVSARDAIGRSLKSGEATLIRDLSASELRLPAASGDAMQSVLAVPVRGELRSYGVLYALSARRGAHGDADKGFLEAVANVLSAALQRIESEQRLAYLAQFDNLTGLPNRALLHDRFSQMVVQSKRHGSCLGVMFVDLDDFKMVNDTLGHTAGDTLLKEAATRLSECTRSGDTVARIGGDEFAVVLGDLARAEDAAIVAQKVIDRLSQRFAVDGHDTFVTASIGIAVFPGDADNADALLAAADAAMYRAKESGRNSYCYFTAEINQATRARMQLGVELRRALEREEFRLVYQPKVALDGRALKGVEALIRWQHPERGMVSPMEFIPALEESGLIVQVGDWVLRRACADLKAWQAAGLNPPPVSVNLSARQFQQRDLDRRIQSAIEEFGVDPSLIEKEITESQLMQDPEHAIRVIEALGKSGVEIAIDDFGTGYSSLAYLTRFPVNALKIDRSFVKDIETDANDAAIVRAIVEMAHTLGFIVVAEGVETEKQVEYLHKLGCEQAQGYLFARPMPVEQFTEMLQRNSGDAKSEPRRSQRRRASPAAPAQLGG